MQLCQIFPVCVAGSFRSLIKRLDGQTVKWSKASGIVAWTLSSKLFGHGLDTDRWEWQERLAAPSPCLGPDSAQSGAGRGGAVLLQLRRLSGTAGRLS